MTNRKIEHITVVHDGYTPSVSWVIGADRYHVWVRGKANEADDTIYKNSTVKHGEPGYYHTRQLSRSTSKVSAAMFAEVWATVERDDLLAKAKLAKDEKHAREAQLTALKGRLYEIEQTVLNLFRNDAVDRIAALRAEYVKVADAILLLELQA